MGFAEAPPSLQSYTTRQRWRTEAKSKGMVGRAHPTGLQGCPPKKMKKS